MTDATVPILGGGTTSAPQDYLVKGGQVLGLMAVRATFDGTLAGGAYLPCVQLVSAAGNVMAQTVGTSVAAGSSADVTFAPFLEAASGGAVTDAVLFNVAPQENGFLEATTTAGGVTFEDHSGSGLTLESEDPGGASGGFISITTADGETFIASTSIVDRLTPAGGAFEVQNHSSQDIVRVDENRYVTFRLGSGTVFAVLGPASALIARFTDGGGGDNSFEMKLPTVNPGGSNFLWNNGGVVNIT